MKKQAFAGVFSFMIGLGLWASESPPKLTEGPTVAKQGDTFRIAFAVDRETDVAVTILDKEGKAVRHLAGGVLGKNAPKPLASNALKQSLLWDGKDNHGNKVDSSKGPFRAKVQVGLKPTFDSFMLYNPDATTDVRNLAIGPKGEVYAFYQDPTANGNQGGIKVKILDRSGQHLKQLVPYPANLPYERVKATGAFQDEKGRLVPHLKNWHSLNFYPDPVRTRGRSMTSFGQPVVDGKGRVYWIAGKQICALDPDGGVPYETFLGPPIDPKRRLGGRPALALSGDGNAIYVGGMAKCIYRIDLTTRKAEVFLGDPDQAGTEKDRFTTPRGVAVANGLLYVADHKAGRIAVFKEADKSFVGEMKVVQPHIVQVHPKTGAVYVCSYVPEKNPRKDGKPRTKNANLLKFADYKAEKPLYQLALPKTGLSPNAGTHRIALDASAEPPLIWAPGLPYARQGRRIACYRDTGKGFESVKLETRKGAWGAGPRDLLVDRNRNDLYVKIQGERWHQFDEKTGKLKRTVLFPKNDGAPYMGCHGSNLGIDPNGNYITHCWGKGRGMMRWTQDLKPLPWEGQKTHQTKWGGMMTFQLNYMHIHNDEIFLIKPSGTHHVDVFDMGLKKKRRVVWNVRRGSCPRVDAQGNIYVTVPIRPKDRDFPPFFDGKLSKIPDYFRNLGEGHYWYTYMYGSIVKFPPQGGAFYWIENKRIKNVVEGIPESVKAKPKEKYQYFQGGRFPHKLCDVQGAEWVRFGYCPYSETYPAGTPVCMCEGTGFDVDPFGRVFYPNLGQFRIEVVDTNNNDLGHFGVYGNQDSGPNGSVKTKEIPLAWPTYVAVSGTHAYVNDTVNMRVVKVKLGYAAEGTAEIK